MLITTALRFAPVAQQKKGIKRLRYLIPFFCLNICLSLKINICLFVVL
jgi:hypothetical protein